MSVEYHFLGFAWIGHDEHLPTVAQAKVRHLNVTDDPREFNLFVTPVELANLCGQEGHRDESFRHLGALVQLLPAFNKALNAVIGSLVTLFT
ncbi:hypothetical protein HZU77_015375 [Neisseriaceae bacterium TC5R-5]|nr:hypothetical protein [Neisseriaceae bacterium TC5R-5]